MVREQWEKKQNRQKRDKWFEGKGGRECCISRGRSDWRVEVTGWRGLRKKSQCYSEV